MSYTILSTIPTYVFWGLQDTATMLHDSPVCGTFGILVVFGFMLWMFWSAHALIRVEKAVLPPAGEDSGANEDPVNNTRDPSTRAEGAGAKSTGVKGAGAKDASVASKKQQREEHRLKWRLAK